MNHYMPCPSRRDFLTRAGAGFGSVALTGLLASAAKAEALQKRVAIDPVSPLTPRQPHFAPRAKNVIFLFMYGGPSQVDLFDYKPLLTELNGKPVPDSLKKKSDK